jgi:hypothetical protein
MHRVYSSIPRNLLPRWLIIAGSIISPISIASLRRRRAVRRRSSEKVIVTAAGCFSDALRNFQFRRNIMSPSAIIAESNIIILRGYKPRRARRTVSRHKNIPLCPAAGSRGITFFSSIVVFPSYNFKYSLATTTLVTTVQTFVAGAASHHDMAAYITGGSITLHALRCCVHGIHHTVCFCLLCSTLVLNRLW